MGRRGHSIRGMPAAVEIRGLVKRYGAIAAVDGVDLTIESGQVYALLGPNGAGKTTLVEILEGYRKRDAGEVRVLGFDPQRQRGELNRRVGIVLQRSTPMEGLTPREMLNFTAKLYDDPMDPNEALELVGLTEHADRRGSKLSGGQKRRLDLATSVIGNPDLIFLDEPTTGFDVAARRQAWSVVRGLTERGATVLLTTHYLDEAENLAQRIGMIKDGRLIFEGDVGALRREMQTDTRISWLPPAGLEVDDLPAAWSAALSEGRRGVDGRLALPSQTPTRDLGELIDWARGRGIGELPELTVEHAKLEQMYLDLVGDGAEKGPADGVGADQADEVGEAASR